MTEQTTLPCAQCNVQASSLFSVADMHSSVRVFPFMQGEITASGGCTPFLRYVAGINLTVFLQKESNCSAVVPLQDMQKKQH